MQAITPHECSRIAQDLQVRKIQVESVVQLLDEGNTVPFVTRYRKERTGGLNEDVIRQIQARVAFLRQLHDRKTTILKTIETQGKLTPELRDAILKADTTKRLEDLYLPYKPKKRSLATAARDKGLEPAALAIWHSDPVADNLDELLPALLNPEKELKTIDDVRAGVQHILAEYMAETATVRAAVRQVLWETGKVGSTKSEKLPEGQGLEYKDYFQFSEPARHIPAHRILALNRGEKEGAVKIKLEYDQPAVFNRALHAVSEQMLNVVDKMPAVAPPPAPPPTAAPEPATPAPPATEPTTDVALAASGEGEAPQHAPALAEPSAPASHETPGPATAAAPAPLPETAAPPQGLPVQAAEEKPKRELKGEPLAADVPFKTPHAEFLKKVLEDALTRLVLPSLEREIRGELTDEAETHAVAVFARNLRSLLLQPPLHNRRLLAIDPGFRTGCKVAVLDEYGNLLEQTIIHPFAPPKKGRDKKAEEKKSVTPAGPATPPAETPPASPTPPESGAAPEAPPPAAESPPPEPGAAASSEAAPPPPVAPAAETTAATTEAPAAMPEAAPAAEPTPPPAEPPAPAPDKRADAKAKLIELIRKHNVQVVALGNGTGCRETEEIVAAIIAHDVPELSYVIVNEAGASVYSVSPVGREEFPELDSLARSTISIGRRLQDPLAELVKVEPQHIGVGLYQHDLGKKELKESLDGVVESCVNLVGVNVNTASIPLLRHVSGLNQMVARELVEYRKAHGPFQGREALQQVPGLGPQRYIQAAGFLKIPEGANPFDRTWIHPESYAVAEQILKDLGYEPGVLNDAAAQPELQAKLRTVSAEEVAKRLNVGAPTVHDILQALARPGRDPREELPPPIFKKGILKIEDLQAGMEMKGTVLNVVDFGAFVDIGLKDSGLVHISQMANRYIKSPYEVVAVNDVVDVWVLSVDKDRHRVSLTMIKPGTERKPQERRPAGGRGEQEGRPPRGRGGPRQHVGAGQGAGQAGPHQGPHQGGPPQGDQRGPPRGRHGHGHGGPRSRPSAPPRRRQAAKESARGSNSPGRRKPRPAAAAPAAPRATPSQAVASGAGREGPVAHVRRAERTLRGEAGAAAEEGAAGASADTRRTFRRHGSAVL
ncbi:MAG: Tex family protein [Gemmataceae bacterium]